MSTTRRQKSSFEDSAMPHDPGPPPIVAPIQSEPTPNLHGTHKSATKRAKHRRVADTQTVQVPAFESSFKIIPATTVLPETSVKPNRRRRTRRRKLRPADKQLREAHQDPDITELLYGTGPDPFHVHADAGLKFPQLFGEMCRNIITEYMKSSPPQANAHFEYVHFVDAIEMQFRKEYQRARFKTYDRFRTKIAFEAATDSKVVMLDTGYSEPKFYIAVVEWDTAHLVPMRLFSKNGVKYVEVRVGAQWERLPPFLDTLVRPQPPSYELMRDYWEQTQKHTQSAFKFMALPLELRRKVYRHAMLSNEWIIRPHFNHAQSYLTLPGVPNAPEDMKLDYSQNLLEASEQIRQEATEEYYRTATFKFYDLADLDCFMKSTRTTNVTKIHLEFAMETHEFVVRDPDGYGTRHFKAPSVVNLRLLTIEVESVAVSAFAEYGVNEESETKDYAEPLKSEEEQEEENVKQENRTKRLFEAYTAMVAHLKSCQVRLICHEASKVFSEV